MNFLEKIIDNNLNQSPILLKMANSIRDLAKEVHDLGTAMLSITNTIKSHNEAIQDLYALMKIVIKANLPEPGMTLEPKPEEKSSKKLN